MVQRPIFCHKLAGTRWRIKEMIQAFFSTCRVLVVNQRVGTAQITVLSMLFLTVLAPFLP
ncbi:MAG: hypothetical protein C0404_07780 [Verrucomicrobia bacterium]|nr:hypothetical protein [Verrucomicrobiota bacterium]